MNTASLFVLIFMGIFASGVFAGIADIVDEARATTWTGGGFFGAALLAFFVGVWQGPLLALITLAVSVVTVRSLMGGGGE